MHTYCLSVFYAETSHCSLGSVSSLQHGLCDLAPPGFSSLVCLPLTRWLRAVHQHRVLFPHLQALSRSFFLHSLPCPPLSSSEVSGPPGSLCYSLSLSLNLNDTLKDLVVSTRCCLRCVMMCLLDWVLSSSTSSTKGFSLCTSACHNVWRIVGTQGLFFQ